MTDQEGEEQSKQSQSTQAEAPEENHSDNEAAQSEDVTLQEQEIPNEPENGEEEEESEPEGEFPKLEDPEREEEMFEEDLALMKEEEDKEMTPEELEALFNKNTESFTCLAQVLMSRSSLLRHPLYHFPPLKDPGIDAAFNYVEPEEPIDDICAEKYRKLCKDLHIVPLSRVINSLPTKDLNLRFYGLRTKQVKAIARALKLNTHVEELNLEESFLTPEAAYYIEETLRENNTLKVLNMNECRIGPQGAANLSEGVMLTQSLQYLDLSNNDLGTSGLKSLMTAFKDCTIKRLNLSHNQLGEDAAVLLASILKENTALEDLDLSWNILGTILAMKTFWEAMALNVALRSLSLAWNGIMLTPAVKQMTKYIKKSETLEFLDLGNNRIGGHSFKLVKGAIGKNKSLRGISLAYNPITPDEALALADLVTSNKSPPNFELLDMENVYVKKEFVPFMKKATRMGKTIKIAGILGNWQIKGPNIPKLLFDRAQLLAMKPKKKKRKRDFGHFIFSLPDKPVRKNDFEDCLKKFKAKKVDNDLVQEIIKQFPYKKHGIDAVAMKEKYHELYPEAGPAPVKKKKKKKGKHKKRKSDKTTDSSAVTTKSVTLDIKPTESKVNQEQTEGNKETDVTETTAEVNVEQSNEAREETGDTTQTLAGSSKDAVTVTSQDVVGEPTVDPNTGAEDTQTASASQFTVETAQTVSASQITTETAQTVSASQITAETAQTVSASQVTAATADQSVMD